MKRISLTKLITLFVFVATAVLLVTQPFSGAIANTDEDKLRELTQKIEEYEREIGNLRSQANTLSNQIAQFDAQIRVTELKINKTEEGIKQLGGRIDQLQVSLDSLNEAFSSRALETYKMARISDFWMMLASSQDIGDAVFRYHFLQKIQEADRSLLARLSEAQITYRAEKTDLEVLQAELEQQTQVLGAQKEAKAQLLEVTKSDEKKYQQLLSTARAELDAIQAIIAGRGDETEAGSVNEGDRIASVIPAPSACSSGAHLHFEVVKNRVHQNPASFLASKTVVWDNAPDSPFSFTGSWRWPIDDPIRITQGYGMTHYAGNLRYYGGSPHTGIDMVNSSNWTVKAAKPGTLYRGAIACGGGLLKYVRVAQTDGYDTYYLHVNY